MEREGESERESEREKERKRGKERKEDEGGVVYDDQQLQVMVDNGCDMVEKMGVIKGKERRK